MSTSILNSFFIEVSTKEFETTINLEKQELIKIDESMKKFYNKHYKIGKQVINEDIEKKLLQENQELKQKLNEIVNSKSWKITQPLRKIKNKNK